MQANTYKLKMKINESVKTDSGREEGRNSSATLRVCVSKQENTASSLITNHPSCEENLLANNQCYIAMTSEKPGRFFLW